ncbi:G-protein coupled receptor family C group 6 member A-like [Pleurodeles waltl]|uniref:G-protein coupled receptor family C group 6 member A-like n=1 Tax=Pleurodeles waltl TaxID=8319 RepID=UPI0037099F27
MVPECLLSVLDTAHSCHTFDDFVGAKAPGDVIIGGLFAVHGKTMTIPSGYPRRPAVQNCAGFDLEGFLQSLAMIHAIESINNSTFLNGIKLGYEIYDTCADVSTALVATMKFLAKVNSSGTIVESKRNYTDYIPRVKAVIGASYSEESIAVSRLLTLQLMPQISYSASADILSDTFRFPSFFRSIPSDIFQTKAMASLIQRSGWDWIGMLTTDDEYGRLAVEDFGRQAMAFNVCIAFRETLPAYLSDLAIDKRINSALNVIRDHVKVNVIIVFLKPYLVIKLFQKALEMEVNKTWIASDNWSASLQVASIPNINKIGKIVGFMFKGGNVSSFSHFLENLGKRDFENNRLLDQYAILLAGCSHVSEQDLYNCISDYTKGNWLYDAPLSQGSLREDFLIASVLPGFVYGTHLAVTALANAIRNLCRHRNCKKPGSFAPWQLLEALQGLSFTDGGKKITFDSKGDINIGYDVLFWKKNQNGSMDIITVAEYDCQENVFFFKESKRKLEFNALMNIKSKCSAVCTPGQMKKTSESQHTCCYECVTCPENHYSDQTDMGFCLSCSNRSLWAPVNSSMCFEKKIEYLDWTDGFAVVLLGLTLLGVMLTFIISIIFTRNLNTPVVKSSGGLLCYVILLCLFFSFLSTCFFVGKPTTFQCRSRQLFFGLSFTLCVACILLKSLKILLAFSFDPKLQSILKCLYKPFTIVSTCTGVQIIICTCWLLFNPPFVTENYSLPKTVILECDEGSNVVFGVMLSYIALLAFICFIFAFRGRKLPENYNEAKFITFGLLIYFIAWITFIPVYLTTFGKYLPAVEMIVILISSFGILCSTFFPKCYIILCKQESNTKSAFLKILYKYSSKSACCVPISKGFEEPRLSAGETCSKPSVIYTNNNCYLEHKMRASTITPKNSENVPQRRRLCSI